MKELKLIFALIFLTVLTACRKEGIQENNDSPEIIYSDWIPANWNLQNAASSKQMGIQDARITEAFLENAVILFYVRTTPNYLTDNVSTIRSIPYTSISAVYYFEASPVAPQIRFRAYGEPGSTISVAWIQDVRYVLIPDGVPLQSLNLGNYQELQERFGIKP
ncbi:hypothetical protein GCM10027051_25540 [Niabella terrae]